MRVFIYWNLHKACFSIRAEEGPAKGRVVAHATAITVRDVVFKVSEAGRQRVLASGRKEVHAGICGTLEGFKGDLTSTGCRSGAAYISWDASDRRYARHAAAAGTRVTYNPKRDAGFVVAEDPARARIDAAPMVVMAKQMGRPAVLAFDPCDMPCAAEG